MLQEHSRLQIEDRQRLLSLLVSSIGSANDVIEDWADFYTRWQTSFYRRYARIDHNWDGKKLLTRHSWFCFNSSMREGRSDNPKASFQ